MIFIDGLTIIIIYFISVKNSDQDNITLYPGTLLQTLFIIVGAFPPLFLPPFPSLSNLI